MTVYVPLACQAVSDLLASPSLIPHNSRVFSSQGCCFCCAFGTVWSDHRDALFVRIIFCSAHDLNSDLRSTSFFGSKEPIGADAFFGTDCVFAADLIFCSPHLICLVFLTSFASILCGIVMPLSVFEAPTALSSLVPMLSLYWFLDEAGHLLAPSGMATPLPMEDLLVLSRQNLGTSSSSPLPLKHCFQKSLRPSSNHCQS